MECPPPCPSRNSYNPSLIHLEVPAMRANIPLIFTALAACCMGAVLANPTAAPATPAYVTAALNDPARKDDAADDARRHAADVVTFAGLKPGDSVVELVPGQGYWTRIFSGVVGPKGHVYTVWPH